MSSRGDRVPFSCHVRLEVRVVVALCQLVCPVEERLAHDWCDALVVPARVSGVDFRHERSLEAASRSACLEPAPDLTGIL